MNNNKLLGGGSFSQVYSGYIIKKPSTTIAIKVINKENKTLKIKEQFEKEIEVIKYLKRNPHENIVRYYDVIEEHENIYIIMEYCDFGDITKLTDLTELEIKEYFIQIVKGLKFLHDNNILHRDLKPSNILITQNKYVKLIDFGLSKINTQKNHLLSQTICGSPYYMSPELLRQEKYDDKSDIWSLGLILYDLIYDKFPFINCDTVTQLKEEQLKNIEFSIYDKNNELISNECLDLMKSMLTDNKNRINWNNLFIHPWINIKIVKTLSKTYSGEELKIKYSNEKLSKTTIDEDILDELNKVVVFEKPVKKRTFYNYLFS